MKQYKCLENVQKEDVIEMGFEELKVLATQVTIEIETEKMKQFLLNIIDVRDAESDSRVITFPKRTE
jgi:hypothetical protein